MEYLDNLITVYVAGKAALFLSVEQFADFDTADLYARNDAAISKHF